MNEDMGVITRQGEDTTARFERGLSAGVDRVWEALTDPDGLRMWLAEPVAFDAQVDGAVHLRWSEDEHMQGQVTAYEPQRLLEYTWVDAVASSLVRFELEAVADGSTMLVLEHSGLTFHDAPEYAAGWHFHLDVLERALRGERTTYQDGTGRRKDMRARYAEIAHTG